MCGASSTKREKIKMEQLTNNEYSTTNKKFIEACKSAELPATKRQAGKFRNKKDKVFKNKNT